ncbi:hypothetical protein WJX77_002797 [Trebouxia sp. C0004]
MSSVADTFGSHHEVMEALHSNFAGNGDAQRANKVDKLRDDMSAACRLREDDIRHTISEISRQVQETQEAATPTVKRTASPGACNNQRTSRKA